MSFGRKLRRQMKKSGGVAKRRQKMVFEPLEPRLLLSSDLTYAAAAGTALNVTLRLDGATQELQLVDDISHSVLKSQALADTSAVVMTGSDHDDTVRMDIDPGALSNPLPVTFQGGAGNDTLVGPGGDHTWNITGTNAGTVSTLTFVAIENLIGGAGDDSFIFEPKGAVTGVVDGGLQSTATGDTLTIIGDGTVGLTYRPDAADASAGTFTFDDARVIAFHGLEPTTVHGLSSFTFTSTGSHDVITVDSPAAGQNRISGTSDGTPFEAVTFYDIPTVTIDTGANDAIAPDDSVTINSNLVATLLQNFTITTGAGDDTLTIHTNHFTLPAAGGALTYNGGTGTDTIDFDASSGGYTSALTIAKVGTDSTLTGTDTSVVTLQGGTVEKIDDANLNVAADSLKTLLSDLETLSDWVRKIAAAGDFASQLPLLFAGDQTTVNMDNAVAFADAIDAVRADLHAYYNTLGGSDFTLNGLESRLKNIADNVAHYAGSILGDFAPKVFNGDAAHFSLSLDGATATPITVNFSRGDALPLAIDEVTGQINAAITATALSGKILADKTDDGRLKFKVLDPNAVNYAISTLGTDNAFSKLGLRLNETMKAVEPALGALTGAASKLIHDASTWITIDPATLTPKLNINVPFDLHRTSTFGVDLGKDIRDLKGIAFDASAQLAVTTHVTADLDLGLTVEASPTFGVTVNSLAAGVQITAPVSGFNLTGDLTVGFLGVHADGKIALNAALALSAPVTLTLGQLTSGNVGGASIAPTAGTFSAEFDLSVLAGLKDGSSDFNPPGVSLTLSGADPFDPSSFAFSDFSQVGDFSDLFSFSNMSPFDMITLLKKIGSSFDDVANSDLFKAFKIPFMSSTLSDALDFVNTFQKAILFDDGGDGTDNGTALVTDLNSALTKATKGSDPTPVSLANRFLVQGDGTHVSLIATDDSITSFSASGLPAVGLNGSATLSGHVLQLTGTPVAFGVLGADGTLDISVTTSGGTETYHVKVTKNATADNTKVGNDVPKLVNASGAPTYRTAQEFASHLVTLLDLDPTVIAPNFDSASDELTFRLQLDAGLPAVQFPVNFNLPLGAFGGFQSTGKLSITPDAGVDLTFGIDLGAGGALADGTALADLIQPLTISPNPGFTGGDLNAYAIAGRLSADALFTVSVNGNDYMVTLLASATSTNSTAADLAADLNASLANAHKLVSGIPEVAATDLTGKISASAIDDSSTGKHRLKLTINHTTVTSFDFNPPSSSIVARELGFQGETKYTSAPSADVVIDAVKDVPVIIGRPEADASFTVAMDGGPSAVINVLNTATGENRTIIDLVNDVRNALAASAVASDITVDAQGTALVFKSADVTAFTITAGTSADKLGLGAASTVNSSNKYDLVITLSNGSKKNVSLTKDDGTPALTIGDIKHAIDRDTSSKVTVGFNADETALLLTDATFVAFAGSLPNPNPAVFRVEAVNGSAAGGKLGILARDAVGTTEKPDGKIAGAAIAGIPILDRLFIKAPGVSDPDMLHASLKIDTGAGIAGTANFGFVGLGFSGTGAIDAGIGASLKDPGTSSGTSGKITLAEIVTALTGDPTTLLAAPTITVDPDSLGHNFLKLTLTSTTGVTGFNVSGPDAWVNFQINGFGDPFHTPSPTLPDIALTYGAGLGDLANFGDLSFDNILVVLTQIISSLDAFESAGPIGSLKIPLVNLSIHDILSNVDKFTSALQSMHSNPAGSLQTLGQKLSEALGVPTTLLLDSHQYLEFKFDFSDSVSKGLNLSIPDSLLSGLPAGFKLSGSAGLGFTGSLDLTLDFGIDLAALTSDPSSVLDDIYIYTDTGLSGSATLSGDNLNLLAGIGPLAVSIEDGSASISGSFGVSVTGSGKVALSDFLASLNPTLTGTVAANLPVSFNGLSIGSIAIADFSDKDHDSNTTEAASLAAFDLSDIHASLTLPDLSSISLFDDLLLSAEGLDTFLSGLQGLLSGDVFATKIPLIGDQLAKGGQFIGKLRDDFVAPLRQAIEAAQNAAQNFADPASNVISGILFDILGPGTDTKPGLNLLQKLDGHSGSAQEDYVELLTNLNYYLAHQTDPALHHVPGTDETSIEWDFTLGGDYNLGPNVNFDLGLPGLGLSMDGTVDVDLHWTLHLGIGFDFKDGFYLVIGDPTNPNDTNWKDLDVGLDVSFSDGFGVTGQLGFLQLKGENKYDAYTANDAAYGFQGSGVTADFAIDLTDGTTGPGSNHLGFAEIGNLHVDAQVKAAAALELGLSLGLNPGVVGAGVASGMPKVLADFVLDWSLDGNRSTPALDFVNLTDIGNAMQDGLQLVEFNDVRLDVGSFVSDVLGPIVKKVKEVTEPFQPIIDVITAPIPVISDLAGSPVTLLDIAASFGHVDPGMIYAVADIIDLVNSIPDPGATHNLEIPLLGDNTAFKLYDAADVAGFGDVHLWDSNFKLGDKAEDLIGKVSGGIGNLKDKIANADTNGDAANAAAKEAVTSMFSGKAGKGDRGFSFPLFDHPEQIFNLLLGQKSDLALVEYRLPVLDFSFEYSQFFPIFGPLGVSIFGTVGLTIDMGFGYDTRGIREFIDSKATHPELLVDGFYLTDLDKSGNDIPELTFFGGIGAAAELNLGIAEAGVAGGIGVEVDFNLHDNDRDGRVRLDELVGNIYDEAVINNDPVFAPLAIFDISGQVFAQLTAFLKIDLFFWQFEQSWNITPKITLVDFSIDFDRVPKLGTLSDSGELRLNMGPYADQRLNGDTTDGAETFTVTHSSGSAGDETLEVSSPLASHPQTYEHVKKLIIEGGEGVDHINVNGVLSDMNITGGAGDDVITLDSATTGRATIHGDAGNDDITGGGGNDVIYGGLGGDTIHGGGGNDIIFGDGETLGDTYADASIAGNDSKDFLYGGDDNDIIFGAGGDDYIEGNDGNDILIGDAGTVALTNGLGTWAVDWSKGVSGTMSAKNGGNDEIHGGAGDDYIFGGAGDDKLYGDGNDDRIFGEAGFDTIEGGTGNDIIFGDGWTLVGNAKMNDAYPAKGLQPTSGGEKDDIKGDAGDDIIFGGGGNDTIHGGDNNDTIYGGTGADLLYGEDGNDTIYGQSENDTIYGGAGDDLLSGDAGNDVVYGGTGPAGGVDGDGTDSIYGGFGSDTLDGGGDSDQYYIYTRGGTAAEFTTIYDSGSAVANDFITIYGTSENDVFLLRAMADAYIPTLERLHTLIEKIYNLGGSDVLASLEDAITRVYTPNAVPDGMLDALEAQYASDSSPSGLAALKASIDSSYVPSATQTAFVAKLNNDGKAIERFNYRNIEGITLNLLYGDDYVASDDTLAVFTINGGVGNDRFQIGQVFKSVRDTSLETANVLPEDVFATLEITRGWLSNGISAPMTINGGDGNDDFTVFHNKQPLTLNGGDGDDTFTIRAFALVGSVDDQRARTDMKGDAGADTIKYAVNAPVGIDGGDGFDTVQVIGTEFSDDFVITDYGVFGAGLNVTYVNIERLKVDGAEGDDRYFVLSTDANVVTEIDGGLGSDTFFVGGSPSDSPIYVTSNDLRGYNGIILDSVENVGPTTGYEGVKIDGIAANVADNDEPFIVVTESGGFSSVTEDISAATAGVPALGWDYDTYDVTLTKPFIAGEVVNVHVLPQEPSPEDEAKGFKTLEFWNGASWVNDLTLTFSSAGTRTVTFRAAHDDASEGKQFAIINHKVDDLIGGTTSGPYDGIAMRSVKVQINDDDRAGAIITRTERPLQVIEGNSTFDQGYAVVLTRVPNSDVYVTLDSFFDQVTFSGSTLISGNTLKFTSGDYNQAQFVTVTPVDDAVKEGFHTDYISHTLTSADVNTTQTRTKYQLDGDPAVVGVDDIPAEKPLDTLLLADRPIDGTVHVWIDTVERASDRFLVEGNTLVFLGPNHTTPEAVTGKVEVAYDYIKPGYDGTLADRQIVDIADNEVASVVVIETDGSTDVIEGGATDTVKFVLTKQPSADVTISLDSFNTRTGGLDPDTLENFAYFEQHVRINGLLSTSLTFSANPADANAWNKAQTVTVSAIDDSKVDGDEIQAFVPSVPTLNKIRGPLFIEGASGSGSLSLPAPLLLPLPQQEKNIHPSDGTVLSFTPSGSPGPGAIEQMTVSTTALAAVVTKLDDPDITTIGDLVGKTLELTKGPGTGIVLDPTQPRNLYDRFWLITEVHDQGDGTTLLTLQNPSQVDTSNSAVTAPNGTTSYAITSLSINFFADERRQVDTMFVYDQGSVADKTGRLTSSDGMVLGFTASLGATETMTLASVDLEAAAKAFTHGTDDLVGHTLRITAGPGLDRTWTITNIVDGAGTKVLTLTKLGSGTESPTALSEFSIDGAIVKGRITGLGMGPNAFISSFAQPGGIRYGDIEVVQANLGTGDDHLTIDYTTFWKDHTTKRDDPFYTLTMVNTGPGNDTVTVNLADGQNGALSLNTQEGEDIVHGENSSLPLVVFGWDGNDEIHGGSGADILFGDRGRVDYVNGDGFIFTRLGHTWEQSKVNPPVSSATETTLTDSLASFPTTYGGLVGLSLQAISPAGLVQYRTIIANTADTMTIDRAWDDTPDNTYFYRISMLPEDQTDGTFRGPRVVWSVEGSIGGNDMITDGGGDDVILGGAGADTVSAGAGKDWVIGDNGRLDFVPVSGGDGPTIPTLVQTTETASGGNDTINGDADNDILVGGSGDDTIDGGGQTDVVLGDQGTITLSGGKIVSIVDPGTAGDDILAGGDDPDLVIGGLGNDTIRGEGGPDILVGDEAEILYAPDGVTIVQINTIDRTHGGIDTIYGGAGDDIVIGGTNSDSLDGGLDRDLVFGDNVLLVPNPGSGDSINPRFRALSGTAIYDANGVAQVGDQAQPAPGGMPAWADWHFTLDQSLEPANFGNDYIAGGGGNDEIFGQLGDDTIQGDGSIDYTSHLMKDDGNGHMIADSADQSGGRVGVMNVALNYAANLFRDANNGLVLRPSFGASTDGDDYIEGNGGSDVIFGNLGQDDIIGGSSSLFSLTTPALRPDGSDLIFGGAGTGSARNNEGGISADGHARDSDMILGDNGNIFRLVGINGANSGDYLTFNYDNYNTLKIIPRAAQLLEYTPGGLDFNATKAVTDIGAADEIHGESGDDFIYGMKGNDVLFGEGQDDAMIGGYGADWISGGTGDDGILGDDGRIFVSRNSSSYGEPLYGIAAIPANQINLLVANSNGDTVAITNVAGALKYTVDLTPYSFDPSNAAPSTLMPRPLYANDIIYGGLGNDSIHGGAGDDAISGAEAPLVAYTNNYNQNGAKLNSTLIESDFAHPFNPGNALGYNPTTTKFDLYDANDPLRKILLNNDGTPNKTNTGKEWILNFNETEGPTDMHWITGQTTYSGVPTDGDDYIFADLGNDWAVGGTGRDSMYGGWGDDLLNVDDKLTTNSGLNDGTDTNPSYEDLAYGGAGRDVLIANTGGDRLIDWTGEFNSYLVPYSPFGEPTVSRTMQPQLEAFLYALSKSQGADQTLAAQYGSDPARNGEPFGELGMVRQQDAAWGDQHGGPRDPQPGNSHGKRDVRVTAGVQPLYETAAEPAPATTGTEGLLTDAQLAPIVAEAKALWTQALGAGDSRLTALDDVQVEVGNLPDERLGVTIGHLVIIDTDAAGYGWFVDGTPGDNTEFRLVRGNGDLVATKSSEASGHMDLLTVVAHELGNVMGFPEDAHETAAVTSPLLGAGQRHLPSGEEGAKVVPAGKRPDVTGAAAREDHGWSQALVALTAASRKRAGEDFFAPSVKQNPWLLGFLTNAGQENDGSDPNHKIQLFIPDEE